MKINKMNKIGLDLKLGLMTAMMVVGAPHVFAQSDCGFTAISEQCSDASTNIVTEMKYGYIITTINSAGTGNSCDGVGNAANQDDFPDDQCYYTITQTIYYFVGITMTTGPSQTQSPFDGTTCSGNCSG